MATLAQILEFAIGDPAIKQRFAASRIQACWDILAEPSRSPERVAWRNKILNDPSRDLGREYLWFLSHPDVQSTGNGISDQNLNAATKSFIDMWAALDAAEAGVP